MIYRMKKILIGVLALALTLPLFAIARHDSYYSSSLRNKINDLDDDRVDDLPIPILFGVRLSALTDNFGDDRDGGSRSHEGLDILTIKGAPIISPTEAVVTRTGTGSSAGKYVYTANPGGETFRYMHLDDIEVRAGDELKVGDIIGYVGNTGNAYGGPHHLHFEIRDGREALDPYPRISEEFSLKEKMRFLENAIDDVDDEEEFIEFVIKNYANELRQAQMAGIDLPEDIADEIQTALVPANNVTTSGDLTLDSEGPLVLALQGFLIAKEVGPAAEALADVGATGYFGPLTQRALAEYQVSVGISPASGYFGPITRAYILTNEKN
ncbi:MAG: hypothetical protein AMXMBFR44_4300 [Candidatus Campbellbacteria bacterium]